MFPRSKSQYMPLIINLGQLASHKVQNPQLLRIKLRSIGIKHRRDRTLPGLLSPPLPALLLVQPRDTKVGHFLERHLSSSRQPNQPSSSVPYRGSSPYCASQGRSDSSNRTQYPNRDQKQSQHRSPSQPRQQTLKNE